MALETLGRALVSGFGWSLRESDETASRSTIGWTGLRVRV
jgi:hypothetical protein